MLKAGKVLEDGGKKALGVHIGDAGHGQFNVGVVLPNQVRILTTVSMCTKI